MEGKYKAFFSQVSKFTDETFDLYSLDLKNIVRFMFGEGACHNDILLRHLFQFLSISRKFILERPNQCHVKSVVRMANIVLSRKLSAVEEDRIYFEVFFIILLYYENYKMVNSLIYDSTVTLLQHYPSFSDILEPELTKLLTFRNWMKITILVIPSYHNKGRLLNVVTRITEGDACKYVTGSGQHVATERRVFIYEQEGNTAKKNRPKRKPKHKETYMMENNGGNFYGNLASDSNGQPRMYADLRTLTRQSEIAFGMRSSADYTEGDILLTKNLKNMKNKKLRRFHHSSSYPKNSSGSDNNNNNNNNYVAFMQGTNHRNNNVNDHQYPTDDTMMMYPKLSQNQYGMTNLNNDGDYEDYGAGQFYQEYKAGDDVDDLDDDDDDEEDDDAGEANFFYQLQQQQQQSNQAYPSLYSYEAHPLSSSSSSSSINATKGVAELSNLNSSSSSSSLGSSMFPRASASMDPQNSLGSFARGNYPNYSPNGTGGRKYYPNYPPNGTGGSDAISNRILLKQQQQLLYPSSRTGQQTSSGSTGSNYYQNYPSDGIHQQHIGEAGDGATGDLVFPSSSSSSSCSQSNFMTSMNPNIPPFRFGGKKQKRPQQSSQASSSPSSSPFSYRNNSASSSNIIAYQNDPNNYGFDGGDEDDDDDEDIADGDNNNYNNNDNASNRKERVHKATDNDDDDDDVNQLPSLNSTSAADAAEVASNHFSAATHSNVLNSITSTSAAATGQMGNDDRGDLVLTKPKLENSMGTMPTLQLTTNTNNSASLQRSVSENAVTGHNSNNSNFMANIKDIQLAGSSGITTFQKQQMHLSPPTHFVPSVFPLGNHLITTTAPPFSNNSFTSAADVPLHYSYNNNKNNKKKNNRNLNNDNNYNRNMLQMYNNINSFPDANANALGPMFHPSIDREYSKRKNSNNFSNNTKLNKRRSNMNSFNNRFDNGVHYTNNASNTGWILPPSRITGVSMPAKVTAKSRVKAVKSEQIVNIAKGSNGGGLEMGKSMTSSTVGATNENTNTKEYLKFQKQQQKQLWKDSLATVAAEYNIRHMNNSMTIGNNDKSATIRSTHDMDIATSAHSGSAPSAVSSTAASAWLMLADLDAPWVGDYMSQQHQQPGLVPQVSQTAAADIMSRSSSALLQQQPLQQQQMMMTMMMNNTANNSNAINNINYSDNNSNAIIHMSSSSTDANESAAVNVLTKLTEGRGIKQEKELFDCFSTFFPKATMTTSTDDNTNESSPHIAASAVIGDDDNDGGINQWDFEFQHQYTVPPVTVQDPVTLVITASPHEGTNATTSLVKNMSTTALAAANCMNSMPSFQTICDFNTAVSVANSTAVGAVINGNSTDNSINIQSTVNMSNRVILGRCISDGTNSSTTTSETIVADIATNTAAAVTAAAAALAKEKAKIKSTVSAAAADVDEREAASVLSSITSARNHDYHPPRLNYYGNHVVGSSLSSTAINISSSISSSHTADIELITATEENRGRTPKIQDNNNND